MRLVSAVFQAHSNTDWELALRLRHPRYRDATWWTWCEQDRPVGALVCAPLRWKASTWSAPRQGYMLGAVAVLPEHRGQDIGRKLVSAVMQERSAAGAGRGLLFAGISPRIYEPVGFQVREAAAFSVSTAALLALQGTPSQLTALDPYSELEELARSWRDAHQGGRPAVYVHREPEDFRRSLAQGVDDAFFQLGASSGFLRLRELPDADAVELVECALVGAQGASIQSALAAIATLSQQLGRSRVQGWWPGHWGAPAKVLGLQGVLRPHPVPPMTVGLDLGLPLSLSSSDEL